MREYLINNYINRKLSKSYKILTLILSAIAIILIKKII